MIYLSFDVETSGPSPAHGSLLSIGIIPVADFRKYGGKLIILSSSLYRTVKYDGEVAFHPDTRKFWNEWPYRLEDATCQKSALAPQQLAEHILAFYYEIYAVGLRHGIAAPPVFAARPAVFDFHWLRDLMERHLPEKWQNLGHPSYSCVDIGSVIAGCLGLSYDEASRRSNWPAAWVEPNPKLHHALADAREQACLLKGVLGAGDDTNQDRSG
jgi:hypothetical protein